MSKIINKKKEPQFNWYHFWFFILLAVIAIAFVLYKYFTNFNGGLSSDQNIWGTFGDYVGGILNPALSFFALIALLYTIIIQSREMRLTRIEFKASSKALKEQSKSFTIQNFENRFFKLIENHKNSALNMQILEYTDGVIGSQTNGKDCFAKYLSELHRGTLDKFFDDDVKYDNCSITIYENKLKTFFKRNDISYYFQEQLDLIDLIISNDDKNKGDFSFYSNVLKRQYASSELLFIFIYHMTLNRNKYIEFFKKTAFFEDLPLSTFTKGAKETILFFGEEVYGEKFYTDAFQKELEENEPSK